MILLPRFYKFLSRAVLDRLVHRLPTKKEWFPVRIWADREHTMHFVLMLLFEKLSVLLVRSVSSGSRTHDKSNPIGWCCTWIRTTAWNVQNKRVTEQTTSWSQTGCFYAFMQHNLPPIRSSRMSDTRPYLHDEIRERPVVIDKISSLYKVYLWEQQTSHVNIIPDKT